MTKHEIEVEGTNVVCSCGWRRNAINETQASNLKNRHSMLGGTWPYPGMHPTDKNAMKEWPYREESN